MVKGHKKTCKKVEKIIDKYRDKMPFLWEWEGKVVPVPDDIHTDATMCVSYQNYILNADIHIQERCMALSDSDLELSVLHEIAHLLLADMRMVAETTEEWVHAEERACWRLAKTWQRLVSE